MDKATAARAALPIPNSAHVIFFVSKQRYGCQCLGSLTCAQMLMHAIAHGGCTDTVRESALKIDSGRKIPLRTGESNLRQWRAGPTLYQLSYIPTPNFVEYNIFGQHWVFFALACCKFTPTPFLISRPA